MTPRERLNAVSEYSLQFSKNTNKLRNAKFMSIDALRRAVGLSHGNIHRIVHGQTEIPLKSAVLICNYFDKNLIEMVYEDVKV